MAGASGFLLGDCCSGDGARVGPERRAALPAVPQDVIDAAPTGGGSDPRALAVELARPLMCWGGEQVGASLGGPGDMLAHAVFHGAAYDTGATESGTAVGLEYLREALHGTIVVLAADGSVRRARDGDTLSPAHDALAAALVARAAGGAGGGLRELQYVGAGGERCVVEAELLSTPAGGGSAGPTFAVRSPSTTALRRALELEPLAAVRDALLSLAPACAGGAGTARLDQQQRKLLRRLLLAWTDPQLACANGNIAPYSTTMAACTRANSVPMLLGVGDAGKAAGYYMLKYMAKPLCDPAASLDVFVAAAQHVRDPERASTAADAHTSRRTALHFAERVLNASMQELEASFAAAIVLDEPSSRASEPVTFISAWDFTRVARAAVCAGPSVPW